jgi:uncharacterized protein
MSYYVWLIAGAAAGGFVNGLAGFGTALFSLGFWLQVLSPREAVSLAVVMSVISGLQGVALVRQSIRDHPLRLSRFLIPGLVGIPLGASVLAVVSAHTIKLVVAGLLIVYAGFTLLRRELPKLQRQWPVVDGIVGFLGGVLGGAASLSGVLPTMWCALQPWPRSEQRAVMQPFNVAILGLSAATFAWMGYYDTETLKAVLIALPVTLTAAQIGIWVFIRITDDQFRRLLVGLMLLSGVVGLATEVLVR